MSFGSREECPRSASAQVLPGRFGRGNGEDPQRVEGEKGSTATGVLLLGFLGQVESQPKAWCSLLHADYCRGISDGRRR